MIPLHDTRTRYGLGSRRCAARFESQRFAQDAGDAFCQRFTSFLPVAIVSGRGRNWVVRIMYPGDTERTGTYLREIEKPVATRRRIPCTP